jgi:hypothetical protein
MTEDKMETTKTSSRTPHIETISDEQIEPLPLDNGLILTKYPPYFIVRGLICANLYDDILQILALGIVDGDLDGSEFGIIKKNRA